MSLDPNYSTTLPSSSSETASIKVAVRVRPLLPKERAAEEGASLNDVTGSSTGTGGTGGLRKVINVLDDRIIIFDPRDPNASQTRTYAHRSRRNKEIRYAFDRVFSEAATQRDVYNATAMPLIDGVLDGYNATVFAYGATGCGKTHTITGTPTDPGIIFLTMNDLFTKITARSQTHHIESTVSYLEVYNENIRDLLSPSQTTYLDLREDDNTSRVVVANLSEHRPKHVTDVMALLMRGNENRTRAPTEANAVSSRSHAVLQICVRSRERTVGVGGSVGWKVATLSIIDLAGSERASVTKNKGERLLEGANINRSLLALGNCINALCSDKPNHVPYRDSKLTRLLKYSLSGNCKVVMIANLSPSSLHYDETHNTLKYANRAKNISTKVQQNSVDVGVHLSQYPRVIEELREEVRVLKGRLEDGGGGESGGKSVGAGGQLVGREEEEEDVHKCRTILAKIVTKERTLSHYRAEIETNERRLSHMRTLHAALLDCGEVGDAQEVARGMEGVYASNVRLRDLVGRGEANVKQLWGVVEGFKGGWEVERMVGGARRGVLEGEMEVFRKGGREVLGEVERVAGRLGRVVVALRAGMEMVVNGGGDVKEVFGKMEEAFGDAVLCLT
ncbi:kinesin-like protein Klp5, partial [Rhizophlyctis rosea]